ncbi:hypothetical protein IMCC9480_1120 [Oxalobacteraceae bacterium IMCC9480]|nr:hypothetical protein IMCC9480_1120 [Oxalobacteraceae bacterium IMCC9480]
MSKDLPMSIALVPQWDERDLPAAMVPSCAVLGTEDAITLQFEGDGAPAVVLTPYTAKRLAQLLERGLQEHAARYGPA